MNKLDLTQLGGLKLKANDLDFANQGVIDALKGLCSGFNIGATDTYKLSSCVVTIAAGNATWTAGYMVIHGEICYVPAGTIAWAGDTTGICWVLADSADATLDPTTFNDGSSKSIHRNRIGVLQVYGAQPDYILESDIQNFFMQRAWVDLPLQNTWVQAVGSQFAAKYKITWDGYVELKGKVKLGTFDLLAILPFSPITGGWSVAYQDTAGTAYVIKIETNGHITLVGAANSGVSIYLDNIRFRIA